MGWMCSCKFITATPQVQSTAAIKEENSGNDGGGGEGGQPVGETEAHLKRGEGPEVVGPPHPHKEERAEDFSPSSASWCIQVTCGKWSIWAGPLIDIMGPRGPLHPTGLWRWTLWFNQHRKISQTFQWLYRHTTFYKGTSTLVCVTLKPFPGATTLLFHQN